MRARSTKSYHVIFSLALPYILILIYQCCLVEVYSSLPVNTAFDWEAPKLLILDVGLSYLDLHIDHPDRDFS
jgi:hypothetical protein